MINTWLKRTFEDADTNKSQGISESELKDALKSLNIKIGGKERKNLLKVIVFIVLPYNINIIMHIN